MKKALAIFCLLLLTFAVTGVNAKKMGGKKRQGQALIDSLSTALSKAKHDTNKVVLLSSLSFQYHSIDAVKGLEYGKQALKLADELHWNKGKAIAYNSMGLNYMTKLDYPFAVAQFESALIINKAEGNKKGMAHNYRNLSIIANTRTDQKEALIQGRQALRLYRDIYSREGEAAVLNNIGKIYMELRDFEKAGRYFDSSLLIYQELGDKNGMAMIWGNLGVIYRDKGDYVRALDYFQKSRKLYEKLDDNYALCLNMYNTGTIYQKQNSYAQSMNMHFKGLAIAEEIKSDYLKAAQSGRIGTCYLAIVANKAAPKSDKHIAKDPTVNLNRSIEYLTKSIEVFKRMGDKEYLSVFTDALSQAYYLAGDFKNAYLYCREYATLLNLVNEETVNVYK